MTADHVAAVLERSGYGPDDVGQLADMSPDQLADVLEYAADFQG